MKKKEIKFTLSIVPDETDLSVEDKTLLNAAKSALGNSYSPYSKFKVAAAILLDNGKVVTGANQENASYPAGICAEGAALAVASSLFPGKAPVKIAITASNEAHSVSMPIAPCGICRQKLVEYEDRFNCNIQILMSGESGEVHIANSAKDLLPLHFSKKVL